jgi:S2P endopeptidase
MLATIIHTQPRFLPSLLLCCWQAGHALAAAAEGVQISAAGCSLMLLVPAAFVELDSADLAGLSRHSMLRVAAAGAWHNVALALASWPVAALLAGAGGGWALLGPARLLLGYSASLSAALALLNMAPVWFLDGQQALEALLLRRSQPQGLPDKALAAPAQQHSPGSSAGGSGRRGIAVQWILHAGTALYAAVLALHLWQMH